jgi:hypothetical protein
MLLVGFYFMENQDTKENLSKLLKVFNADSIISPEQIQEVLSGIVKILADNKRGVDSLNEETRGQLQQAIQAIAEERQSILESVRGDLTKSKTDIEKATKAQNDRAFKRLQELIDKTRFPKDGKDADEEAIVGKVLEQIKLPEYQETVLDSAEQIRDKLETLEDEERLDAKAIKGWEKIVQKLPGGKVLVGGIRFFENLADVSIPITSKRKNLVAQYSTTNNRWENGVAITVSLTEPTDPQENDIWIDLN